MDKKVTIKDIAKQSGVSVGSVHCALNGKQGVGEETRTRILDVAKKLNYRPNTVASSLKRKTLRIAAAFPGPTEDNRFYYTYVWEGLRDYLCSMQDFNIELIEVPYYNELNNQADELCDLLERTTVDGLITVGYMDNRSKITLRKFTEKKIPVILVGADMPNSGRLCCIQPNYRIIGRTLAELIHRQIAPSQGILLCAGDVIIPAHFEIVQGFDAYMEENKLKNPVYKIHANKLKKEVYDHIVYSLNQHEDIAACCCVNARSSVLLGQALKETYRAGKLVAIGSDLFEENLHFLQENVFTNLLHKNPYSQSYLGAKYLVDYLLRDLRPPMEQVFVGSEIVFQSSLPMYENGPYANFIHTHINQNF